MIKLQVKSCRIPHGDSRSTPKASRSFLGDRVPTVLPLKQMGLSPQAFSSDACHIVETLQQQGFAAYIVGGAVRDILLHERPQDFDVVTEAPPETVRRLFRRSRIIGRRFRLVHVIMGKKVIEVSTFRGQADKLYNTTGRIMQDNTFGSCEEDMLRRDFTINALLYEPTQGKIIDYVGGLQDLVEQKMVMIGEPLVRCQEDPIRILRALRFAAKLGFTLEQKTEEAILSMMSRLNQEPAARLWDEMLKCLTHGYAAKLMRLLDQKKLSHLVFPWLQVLDIKLNDPFVRAVLDSTDARVLQNKSVSVGFLMASLIWQPLWHTWQTLQKRYSKPRIALKYAIESTEERLVVLHFMPRRLFVIMKTLWLMQVRFEWNAPDKSQRLMRQPAFRAGLDFFLLRATYNHIPQQAIAQWLPFQ